MITCQTSGSIKCPPASSFDNLRFGKLILWSIKLLLQFKATLHATILHSRTGYTSGLHFLPINCHGRIYKRFASIMVSSNRVSINVAFVDESHGIEGEGSEHRHPL